MKTIIKILIIFSFYSVSNIYSQSLTFKKVYSGFDGHNIISCKPYNNDNFFFIEGHGPGLHILKINSTGEIILQKNILYPYLANFIFSNTFLTLYSSDNWANKVLIKLDTSFNILLGMQFDSLNSGGTDLNFHRQIDNSVICPTKDNGFILSGTKHYLLPLIVKIDSNSNIKWAKCLIPIQGGIQDIVQANDSGYIIAANLLNAAASLIRIDKNGNVLWAKSYFRPRGYIHSLIKDSNGDLIMIGNMDTINIFGFESLASPLFFTKLDQYGNIIWSKEINELGNGILSWRSQIIKTKDLGYIILTTLAKPYQMGNLLLIKTNNDGDTLWCRAHGSIQSSEYGQSIEQLNDKGFIISGITNNNIPVPGYSLYIIRTDSLGHTDSLCEEYSLPLSINNINIYDSALNVSSIPFNINTSGYDTSVQNFTIYSFDGCYLDDIPELFAEQTAPLLIYPNPNEGLFSVEMKMGTPVKTEIEIYNINAEKIYTGYTVDGSINMDLSAYSNGLYFVRMSNERWVKTGKVMIR